MVEQHTYTISDLARDFDVTTRTIRFYEEKGLLNPSRIGQHRIFDRADHARLELILRGKRAGHWMRAVKSSICTTPTGTTTSNISFC